MQKCWKEKKTEGLKRLLKGDIDRRERPESIRDRESRYNGQYRGLTAVSRQTKQEGEKDVRDSGVETRRVKIGSGLMKRVECVGFAK